jgi:hypothetical protein
MKKQIIFLSLWFIYNTAISADEILETPESTAPETKTLMMFNTNAGSAYLAANLINILGDSNISTTGADSTISINLDITAPLNNTITPSAASPTSSVTANGRIVSATFTGFTTAINSTQSHNN